MTAMMNSAQVTFVTNTNQHQNVGIIRMLNKWIFGTSIQYSKLENTLAQQFIIVYYCSYFCKIFVIHLLYFRHFYWKGACKGIYYGLLQHLRWCSMCFSLIVNPG